MSRLTLPALFFILLVSFAFCAQIFEKIDMQNENEADGETLIYFEEEEESGNGTENQLDNDSVTEGIFQQLKDYYNLNLNDDDDVGGGCEEHVPAAPGRDLLRTRKRSKSFCEVNDDPSVVEIVDWSGFDKVPESHRFDSLDSLDSSSSSRRYSSTDSGDSDESLNHFSRLWNIFDKKGKSRSSSLTRASIKLPGSRLASLDESTEDEE